MLRPGARAVVVVPAGPGTYDYYDRFLGHERRYARGELAGKARDGGTRSARGRAPRLRCCTPRSGWSSSATAGATAHSRARRSSSGWRRHRRHAGLARRSPRAAGWRRGCCGGHTPAVRHPRPHRAQAAEGAHGDPIAGRRRSPERSVTSAQRRDPGLQRGGERRAGLRAAERRCSTDLDMRLGADLQRRPVDRPHRGADPRACASGTRG